MSKMKVKEKNMGLTQEDHTSVREYPGPECAFFQERTTAADSRGDGAIPQILGTLHGTSDLRGHFEVGKDEDGFVIVFVAECVVAAV